MSRPEFVWVFDQNHRVYRKPEPGDIWAKGGPVWREHWRKYPVVGETRLSWILSIHTKVPKKNPSPRAFAFSEAQIDELEWLEVHRYKVADRVQKIDDPALMKQVAALIGYEPVALTRGVRDGE